MNQIDHLLIEAEQAVLSEISWLDDFKVQCEFINAELWGHAL